MRSLATLHDVAPGLDLSQLSEAELLERAEALRDLHLLQARGEPVPEGLRSGADCFIEYAIPHELTNEPIENGQHHLDWHDHLSSNRFAVILAPVGHGKTQQIAVGRVLYELGRNPNLRIGLISNAAEAAEKILGLISQHVLENPRVLEVFPHLRPAPREKKLPWKSNAITFDRSSLSKDPSIQAFGAGGPVVGSRLDLIVLDDVLDFDNTLTPEQCKKIVNWFDTTVYTRLPPGDRTSRIWCIGTPWNREDLLHVLKGRPAWADTTCSAVLNPRAPQSEWIPLWSDVVSAEDLREKWENMTPHAFARKFLCQVRDDASRRFQDAWIKLCLRKGRGRRLLARAPLQYLGGPQLACFTGVDLGVGEDEDHDLSCLFTIAMEHGRRSVIDIQSGRWTGPEIVTRIQWVYHRFNSIVAVESNAAQDYIRQFSAEKSIPTIAMFTGKNKHHEDFGIESIAVELRAGMWIIPSNDACEADDDEVKAWIEEMDNYLPGPKHHTGDRLMASWHAREISRQHGGQIASVQNVQYR